MILKTEVVLNNVYALGKHDHNISKLISNEEERYIEYNLNLQYIVHYYKAEDGNTVVVLTTQQEFKIKEDFYFFEKMMYTLSPVKMISIGKRKGTIMERVLSQTTKKFTTIPLDLEL